MIEYTCNHCGHLLETDDSLGMKEEVCPVCKKVNLVPPSRKQKREQKEKKKAIGRQFTEHQRRAESARRAEAERVQRQREAEKQQQYLATIDQAKADPQTPKVWYCQVNGQERGPIKEAIVQRWIDDGELGLNDCIRTEECNSWIRLSDIPERFHVPVPESNNNAVHCPKCGGTQIAANKKGMDAGNACCGALLLGPLGLLCGLSGSNKVIVTCLNCGHQWNTG